MKIPSMNIAEIADAVLPEVKACHHFDKASRAMIGLGNARLLLNT